MSCTLPVALWIGPFEVEALGSRWSTLGVEHAHPRQFRRKAMGFDQYHEPPQELPEQTRTFARLCASLTEEAEAIGWYEQRLAVEQDPEARSVMADAVGEEYKHFCMDLEFLLRRTPKWREIAQGVLLQSGGIVENGEAAEAAAGDAARQEPKGAEQPVGSLGIGSLKGVGL
jgi:uncharacterized protein